jgi:hypothetical protein
MLSRTKKKRPEPAGRQLLVLQRCSDVMMIAEKGEFFVEMSGLVFFFVSWVASLVWCKANHAPGTNPSIVKKVLLFPPNRLMFFLF